MLLHQVDQIGAAGDEFRGRVGGDPAHRVGDVAGSGVLEIDHDLHPCACADRRDDVGIGAAAADVAAHQLADLVVGLRPAFGQQARGRADLARRAVAALECVVVDERLLQRMQRAVHRQAFDGGDLGAILHDGEREARIDAPAVDQDRAGAALPVVAALLGAGQVEMVAQRIEQGCPRREVELPRHAVDGERDRNLVGCRDAIARRPRRRAGSCHLQSPPGRRGSLVACPRLSVLARSCACLIDVAPGATGPRGEFCPASVTDRRVNRPG